MTDTAKQASDYFDNCRCHACEHWRAKNDILREEVERLRSALAHAAWRDHNQSAGCSGCEQVEAALREGQKGSE